MFKFGSDIALQMESLNALFEHATEGIIIANEKGIMVKVNPSTEKLFGYNHGELIGLTVETLIPIRYGERHQKHRANYANNPHSRPMGKDTILSAMRKDGSEFPVEISLSYYTKEESLYVIAFIIDITERAQNEERIKKLNSNLENKVKERTSVLQEALIQLETSKEDLKDALQKEKDLHDLKSRFVTMASHEFRTPLSTILSSISLISKYALTEDDEKRQKHVQRIKSAVTNMTLILNDFLSAERLEEGKIFAKQSDISIENLIKETILEMRGILKHDQKIKFKHSGESIVNIDPQMVKNILINMVSNAIKFSGEGTKINIESSTDADSFKITITDQGVGIPPEEQEHLYERFFRAKNVTNIQGTGLGLNIVNKYLDAMNGKIEFISELGKGTTFKITIPTQKIK